MTLTFWVTLSAGMLFLSASYAQSLAVGPQLGYREAKDADHGRLTAGAALRLPLSSLLALEAAINYRQEKYSKGGLTLRSWPVMASALIYAIPLVHGTAGAGWYNTTLDYNQSRAEFGEFEDETTQKFGWHIGSGIDLPVCKSVVVAADIRYVYLDYDFKALPSSRDLKSDFYVISAGLLWEL